MKNSKIKNCSRSLRKVWFDLMNAADYSCSMNHAIDAGEWSGSWDGQIYQGAFAEFKNICSAYGIRFRDFKNLANRWGRKDHLDCGGWGEIAQSIAMFESYKK